MGSSYIKKENEHTFFDLNIWRMIFECMKMLITSWRCLMKMVSHVIPSDDIIPLFEAHMRDVAFERFRLLFFHFQCKKKCSMNEEAQMHN